MVSPVKFIHMWQCGCRTVVKTPVLRHLSRVHYLCFYFEGKFRKCYISILASFILVGESAA